jgi:FkbM family methyltransferase
MKPGGSAWFWRGPFLTLATGSLPGSQHARIRYNCEGSMPANDRNYRKIHFSWKQRIIAAVSRRMDFTYTVRHGLAVGMRRRGGLGFIPWLTVETEETRFLRGLELRGLVVYDIGAFEGILTMFFSRQARHVVAYEPNPASRSRLLTNIRLNDIANVTLRDIGLADAVCDTTLIYDPLMPGAASASDLVARQIRDHASTTTEVRMHVGTLDGDIQENSLPVPDLLKIDVEGMELGVLRGAEATLNQYHPALYIELHGAQDADKRQNARELMLLLWDWGYRDVLDVEAGRRIAPEETGRPSHLYCRHSSRT